MSKYYFRLNHLPAKKWALVDRVFFFSFLRTWALESLIGWVDNLGFPDDRRVFPIFPKSICFVNIYIAGDVDRFSCSNDTPSNWANFSVRRVASRITRFRAEELLACFHKSMKYNFIAFILIFPDSLFFVVHIITIKRQWSF